MKTVFLLATVLAAATAASYQDLFREEWNLYKAEYQKSYDSPLENIRRMNIFLENKYEIAQHNLRYRNGEESYEMAINHFSDWLPEELAAINGFNKDLRDRANAGEEVEFPELEGDEFVPAPNTTAPASINWVQKGAVSPVKNQGSCGSCYAFSALGALETQKYFKTKKMVRLSEQNIVDCSTKYGNKGCNGGNSPNTYKYIKENGGVDTESSYPYEGKQGKCRFKKENVGATVSSYVKVGANEEALKEAVASIGPISVSINTLKSLTNYKGGIYEEPKCKNDIRSLDHAVLVVGYGTESGKDYWLVKNSWGTAWGEKGYVRMARNKNNMCGIATFTYYPRV